MPIISEGPGDLFASQMQALVCPANTRGAMGAGLALAFKQRYPGLFKAYWACCEHGGLTTHKPFVYDSPCGRKIVCLATKDDWRSPSRVEYVRDGLLYIRQYHAKMGLTGLAVPALGCGLGGLDYQMDVRNIIYRCLGDLPFPVEILLGH